MSRLKEVRLGDLTAAVTIIRGFPTNRTAKDGVPVMSIADIRNDLAPRHYADIDAMEDIGLDFAEPGDVLVAIEGGTVGETMTILEDSRQFVPSQQAVTLRVTDRGVVDPWYLGAWLATEQGHEQLRRLARGAAIQRIPISALASLPVILPPLAQQRDIGRRFIAFENAIKAHRNIAACLEDLCVVDLAVAFAEVVDSASASTNEKAD